MEFLLKWSAFAAEKKQNKEKEMEKNRVESIQPEPDGLLFLISLYTRF